MTLDPPGSWPSEAAAWKHYGLSRAGLTRFVEKVRERIGLEGDVDVLLTGDAAIRRLNREFRGKNKATDVLSFPADASLQGVHAGDLAVSVETAARQAEEHGHTLPDEVRILLLHGLLHLNGMDHQSDHGEMAEREAELRRELRLKRGLIQRTANAKDTKGTKARKGRSSR